MNESPKDDPRKRRPAQRVDLGASSGPAPWLDDSALVKSLRAKLVASQAECQELRAELAVAKRLNGRWMDEATQAKIDNESARAELARLRAVLAAIANPQNTSSGDLQGATYAELRAVQIARAALAVEPGQGAERVRRMERVCAEAVRMAEEPLRCTDELLDAVDSLAALATPGKGEE